MPASCSALRERDRLSGDTSVADAGSVHKVNDLRAKASKARLYTNKRTNAREHSHYLASCQVELNNDVVVSGGACGCGAEQITAWCVRQCLWRANTHAPHYYVRDCPILLNTPLTPAPTVVQLEPVRISFLSPFEAKFFTYLFHIESNLSQA